MAHNKNFFLDTMKANKKARDFMDTILGQGGGTQPADCEAYFQQLVQRAENVKTKSTLASRTPPPYHWNVEADMFAIAAHCLGQTSTPILTQLCKNGYEVTTADITASLNRQGVPSEEAVLAWTAPTSGLDAFRLDSRADAFIKPHTMLATQILTELDAKGYTRTATSVGVGASLGRQGRDLMRVR